MDEAHIEALLRWAWDIPQDVAVKVTDLESSQMFRAEAGETAYFGEVKGQGSIVSWEDRNLDSLNQRVFDRLREDLLPRLVANADSDSTFDLILDGEYPELFRPFERMKTIPMHTQQGMIGAWLSFEDIIELCGFKALMQTSLLPDGIYFTRIVCSPKEAKGRRKRWS